MSQGKPKDHYVPQFYLDAFAIEGPEIKNPHIYQYMEDKIVSPRISDIASEKDFYTLTEKGTGNPIRDVDNLFTHLEGVAASPIKKIIKEESLNLSEKEYTHLSEFIAIMAVRTPSFLKSQESMSSETIKELMAIDASDKDRLREGYKKAGILLTEGQLEEQQEFTINKKYDVTFENSKSYFLAQGLKVACDLADWYSKRKHWHLLINDSPAVFITSDNPISIYKPIFERLPTAGFGNGTLIIPISPKLALLLRDLPLKKQIFKINVYHVNKINKNIMKFSDNYIFSNLGSKKISELYKKVGKKCFQNSKVTRMKWAPYIFMGPPPAPIEPFH